MLVSNEKLTEKYNWKNTSRRRFTLRPCQVRSCADEHWDRVVLQPNPIVIVSLTGT